MVDPKIIQEIYDPSHIGAVVLDGLLDEEFCEGIARSLVDTRENYDLFGVSKNKQGHVYQDMQTFYCEDAESRASFPPEFAFYMDFLYAIDSLNRENLNFQKRANDSIGVHFYPQGSAGISPHRDYASDINLISIYCMSGEADFCVARTRDREGEVRHRVKQGSVIFMRAAREDSEQDLRPFHYVENVDSDRYSIIFRERECKPTK